LRGTTEDENVCSGKDAGNRLFQKPLHPELDAGHSELAVFQRNSEPDQWATRLTFAFASQPVAEATGEVLFVTLID